MSDGRPGGVPEAPPPPQGPPTTFQTVDDVLSRRAQRHAERAARRADRYARKHGGAASVSDTPPPGVDAVEWRARKRAKELRSFYTSLLSAACILGFFFLINLLTGPGSWWFYWIAIPLGIGLVGHAYAVFGPSHWFDESWEQRKAQQLAGKPTPQQPAAPAAATPPREGEVAQLVAGGVAEVAQIRALALRIGKPQVREQALNVAASADRILAVLAEHPDDAQPARDFIVRYVKPTQTIVSQYVRLTSRGVSSAEPVLAKVEAHDLPLLDEKMDELYERLHRGDVIDLQVASEMLDLEFAGGHEQALNEPPRSAEY